MISAVSRCMRISRAKTLFLIVALAVSAMALTCSDAVTITFVNSTSANVSVYKSQDTDDFLLSVPAHSERKITVVEKYWQDRMVLRRNGEIFRTVPLSWDELSEQGDTYEYVITE